MVKEPQNLTERVNWLRNYFFSGTNRNWNNEFNCYSTGTPWDVQYDELTYYIVPEMYRMLQVFKSSISQAAIDVPVDETFWKLSLPERRASFLKDVMVNHLPHEILPGDLLAGARFNMMTSNCWTREETKKHDALIYGKKGARQIMKSFHDHGYGNSGATSGHLIPDYARVLERGFISIYDDLEDAYEDLASHERNGEKGNQLRAMMTSAKMVKEFAEQYSILCEQLAEEEKDIHRKEELEQMALSLKRVPWLGAQNFWEAIQSLWLTHMLVMADENYPGPGVSFGRLDQYLYPYYKRSLEEGMSKAFMKEILGCFWFHCNTAYDAQIQVGGNQGISASFGQLFNLSGLGPGGKDMTNDLTYLFLEVIDEITPILEPKPNVRLHRDSPELLLDKLVDMIASSQGAPFILNFDERSMAGMLREAKLSNVEELINDENVFNYAAVGCLENTMVGNDRSGTVDNNLNLLKAVELALNNGKDMLPYVDDITGKVEKIKQDGPRTGKLDDLDTWEKFWNAYEIQTQYIVDKIVSVYEKSESIRARYNPTPYVSLLVRGCIENGKDITQGGAQLSFSTIEGVAFATTVDSLLAIKHLVYDSKECTLHRLVDALKDNWRGHEVLQAKAKFRTPKYGRDDDEADDLACEVMNVWSKQVWKHKTKSTNRQFRPGMLSWNYWIGDGFIMAASADGREKGQFLSNAICPSTGADINGPTSNANSVGKSLGGKADIDGDYQMYKNSLPNGASHTMSFSKALLKDPGHREKFKAFLRGYAHNGGTALQINILDADMLTDAQKHPCNYRHLLVRVTGYNAYFTSLGKELQDEIIMRECHNKF